MNQAPVPPAADVPAVSDETKVAIEDLELQLGFLWRRARSLNHALTRSVHPDLEPAAYGLLSILMNRGGMRLTELAKFIGVGKPSVSRQITFLEGLGMVSKVSDPTDGRAQLIELTPTGMDKMRAVHTSRQEAFHSLLSHWDTAELTTLATLIAKLNGDSQEGPN
ncbi:MarR family winged helix-turn-helix transcriptional regulator [Arthrobacter sp. GMC3]|uniref:MarR family winged helix-turn-helix transcriptional regulator n=1 Tax=Arthrobacter sp. GMC3 TaxID=2058894 RepID=UPI000CE38638|nr:MarR family transcriptional regulator [Arthrobacter sp. GMC3]